jgi:hypothetical protein
LAGDVAAVAREPAGHWRRRRGKFRREAGLEICGAFFERFGMCFCTCSIAV